ncbi:hypothetical protein UFOVP338_25 [uncultured Caudovirales phage]|uniref:Uncharacterized protein n=1 Tax=uncultured Caudovirales phage TaxID=2100421 RepID=A0A6J5LXK9_9CAUD|nr:hypothetical protein UFOVP338_25 [uncultured Caudovirales phage]
MIGNVLQLLKSIDWLQIIKWAFEIALPILLSKEHPADNTKVKEVADALGVDVGKEER